MRKIVPFLFLAVILLHTTGVHFFFYGTQLKLKSDVQRILQSSDTEKLEELHFSVAEFDALLKANTLFDEFRVGDELYDLKSIERHGNTVIAHVLHDTEEESLLNIFASLFEKNSSSKSTGSNVEDNSLPEFTIQQICFVFAQPIDVISIQPYNSSLLSGNLQHFCPPPDFRG
ncbi:MAG: hypothetical protein U0V74_07115 [Chitinophagales bacterium]